MKRLLHTRLSAPLRALVLASALGAAALPATTGWAQPAPTTATATAATTTEGSTASTSPAPVATTAAAAAEPAHNPYGMAALWHSSDLVAKTVLLLLLIMSVGSWYVIVQKLIEQQRMGRQARATTQAEAFWSSQQVAQAVDALPARSPFRFIAEASVTATRQHPKLAQHMPLSQWSALAISRAVERIQSRVQQGLPFLATVGSTSPFVGLFGTVWGIYHALSAIGVAGQASIDKVAGPVGEALIMTAIGLAVAVPAVLGYNWLVRRNKAVMDEVRAFGNELHTLVLSTTSATPAAAKA